ncbi:hypothetical protein KIN20_035941 [Parelaphostrongylus tenuis]|uniref:Uncharacterized protein n=1 Tax=Parelaphostrongylus tenuis TaxID=148309 RepID=A0AAD5RCP2_PARTN|nr:hypothetical protein KIN20_035941 [Parelaphostrongylus tenuis]
MFEAALTSSIVMIWLPDFSLSTKSSQWIEEEWHCGTEPISHFLSESQLELDCPRFKRRVNQCCKRHDDCYEDQSGRKYCDDKFCECLTVATRGSGICARENGPLMCLLVRELGEEAYKQSAPDTAMTQAQNTSVSTSNARTSSGRSNVRS